MIKSTLRMKIKFLPTYTTKTALDFKGSRMLSSHCAGLGLYEQTDEQPCGTFTLKHTYSCTSPSQSYSFSTANQVNKQKAIMLGSCRLGVGNYSVVWTASF